MPQNWFLPLYDLKWEYTQQCVPRLDRSQSFYIGFEMKGTHIFNFIVKTKLIFIPKPPDIFNKEEVQTIFWQLICVKMTHIPHCMSWSLIEEQFLYQHNTHPNEIHHPFPSGPRQLSAKTFNLVITRENWNVLFEQKTFNPMPSFAAGSVASTP